MKAFYSNIGIIDVIDLLLVSLLLYELYKLIKGTPAQNIVFGILSIYIFFRITEYLEMRFLSGILSQFTSVGVIALMIVFQQEIRRFLLLIGKSGFGDLTTKFKRIFQSKNSEVTISLKWAEIEKAVSKMASQKTGALIIISDVNEEKDFEGTGVKLNAELTSELLQNIFFKNSPLHDGAVFVVGSKLKEAKIVLPLSENPDLPTDVGMRHRAAVGVTELNNVFAIIVSEQTGSIAYSYKGKLVRNISIELLRKRFKEFKERKL